MSNLLVEEYRGSIVENVHRGFICGVSDKRKSCFFCWRSKSYSIYAFTAKPIQAIPVFKLGFGGKNTVWKAKKLPSYVHPIWPNLFI